MGFEEILEILVLGVGLSMDAFAVSVCKGLAVQRADMKTSLVCGAWFGAFQALMPLTGYFLGNMFAEAIQKYDHWVTFGLLALIGANMIKEALSDKDEPVTPDLSVKSMLPLAVATSIDALAVGITLAVNKVHIWAAIGIIGVTTFIISAIGVAIGGVFGNKYEKKAEILGGAVLILLGIKFLLQGLGIL